MPIYCPGAYGVIIRKSPKTQAVIAMRRQAMRAHHTSFGGDQPLNPEALNEDEHLAGFSVAQSSMDMAGTVRELEASGLVPAQDFVPTNSVVGVFGTLPSWLRMEPADTAAELEAIEKGLLGPMLERTASKTFSRALNA
jgi:hypothetical protein